MPALPVIFFEPDGYVLDGPKLMGRQSAGNGFLRAAIDAVELSAKQGEENELFCYTPSKKSAEVFAHLVNRQSPQVKPRWLPSDRLDHLAQRGALFLPGPGLGEAARRRLRAGVGAWSLTGTTYTLCSHTAMDAIVDIISAPVMPWDGLICATSVAKKSVETLFELQARYYSWRFGAKNFVIPELPIIPFGVHQKDFNFTQEQRQGARKNLRLASEEIAVLFAGRLSFHAKAHPYPMFKALEDSALLTGKKLKLILCGQFPNDAIKSAFLSGVQNYAPSIALDWVNGKEFNAYNQAWAAADIFISLSDNIQETFGITPVEAMAAGLPVIVSDWDGYKDTIVEGETGFRIPTWMPPPDLGMALASAFECGTINYDQYIGYASLDVSVDNSILVSRLCDLISRPDLRRKMGENGRARVAANYDWAVVMRQHQDLWAELNNKRLKVLSENSDYITTGPNCTPARQDPYRVFGGFPTHFIAPKTRVSLGPETWRLQNWHELSVDPLFSFASDILPNEKVVFQIIKNIEAAPDKSMTIGDLARSFKINEAQIIKITAILSKAGLISFSTPE